MSMRVLLDRVASQDASPAPEHARIASFDGEEYARIVGLTTAVFDYDRLGRTAFAALTGASGNKGHPHID